MSDFESYQSPFSWRYGSQAMRTIWSEHNKRLFWRSLWVSLAEVQTRWNLVTLEQLEDLKRHASQVDLPKSFEVESSLKHDLMAEIKVFAAQCPVGGGVIHLGATSMDIKDNAEALQIRQSIEVLAEKLKSLLLALASLIERTASMTVMAFTHLQPAEPTTLGYRFANFAQDLLEDYEALIDFKKNLRGKGFKGAVGNAASYIELFGEDGFEDFERQISELIDLPFFPVTTQTYPRRQDYILLSRLAGLAATLSKFAFDLRVLQSQPIGELSEPFGQNQVGSSAMPFKRNPIDAEKIDSLARTVSVAPQIAWHNAANSLLERTLDDSANRRTLLPESFLALDEMVITTFRIISGIVINQQAIDKTKNTYAPFAGIERLLMVLVKKGADRQKMHELLREHSLAAWQEMADGKPNPLVTSLTSDPILLSFLSQEEILHAMDSDQYVGIAQKRALSIAHQITRLFDK
ncbi:MAG: adenylosuccinate lyase [Chloroflexi bacterium]|nr:MAG: adenylosuccinate lyase [Chloroflexota bacterium]